MSCDEELMKDIITVYENIILYTNTKLILNRKYRVRGNVNYEEWRIQNEITIIMSMMSRYLPTLDGIGIQSRKKLYPE
jgi:hypothetical protein